MRILILGGFGYLGGRIGQYLSSLDYDISLSTRNLCETPYWLETAKVVALDWNKFEKEQSFHFDYDAIIHSASPNMQETSRNSEEVLNFNETFKKIVSAAIKSKIKRFIYLSSAQVYGSSKVEIIDENSSLIEGDSYSKMHIKNEKFISEASNSKLIEGVILRLANVVGPPADKKANCWHLLVNDLCLQVVKTKKIILRTSGRQKKNFLSILDLFCAINFLLNKPYEELNDGIFNLGSDNTISVIEMAHLIHDRAETVLGISSELVISETNNEYVNSKLDYKSNKLKEIGFTCHGNIIDEIDQTLKFCKINFT